MDNATTTKTLSEAHKQKLRDVAKAKREQKVIPQPVQEAVTEQPESDYDALAAAHENSTVYSLYSSLKQWHDAKTSYERALVIAGYQL